MKRNLTKFMAIGSVALLMLSACKKNETLPTSNGGKAGTLSSTASSNLALDKSRLNDTSAAVRFTFTAANYGYSAAVTNTLQIDLASDNWAHPVSASLGAKVYSQGYSTMNFNNLLLQLKVPAGVPTPIQIRVMHSISASVTPIYSNTLSLTATDFNLTSYVYLPGAYEGWSNPGPQEDSLVSVTGNGVYVGIINFTAGNNQFLIVPVKGSWNNKWATTQNPASGTTATYSTEYVSSGGNNFYAPATAGQYLVTFDSNAGNLTIAPADYYSIIGSATPGGDWSTDLFLKFINDGKNNWTGTFSLLAGQFKVRQDAAWTNSWGTSSTAGVLTDASGGNINNTAGNATITFNMAPTPFGTTPAQTAPYTLSQ